MHTFTRIEIRSGKKKYRAHRHKPLMQHLSKSDLQHRIATGFSFHLWKSPITEACLCAAQRGRKPGPYKESCTCLTRALFKSSKLQMSNNVSCDFC